jgi:ribosome-binding factor A
MADSKRQLKVSRQLQKDLSDIFRLKLSDSIRNALLTITRVQVSPDLSVARIYISVMATGKVENVIDQVNLQKSELRRALGNRIRKQVRKVPELIFVEDQGSEHAQNIDDILSRLDIPPQSEKP